VVTLTDFLLARIAEDETRAPLVDQCPYNLGDITEEEDWAGVHWTSARVLAECEAKRRIVGLIEDIKSAEKAAFDEWGDWHDSEDEHPSELIVRLLAAVYADHPDYREEWRP
jgi:hypothetical protein